MPIFVVGCNRSGTTLAERMLRYHPRGTGPGFETQAFSRLSVGRAPDHPLGHERYAGGPARHLRQSGLRGFERAAVADVQRTGATHWVEKTPEHVFHIDRFVHRYPDARVVQVLRDGRDVVTSFLEFPSLVPHARSRFSRLVAGCALWEWMVLEGLRAQSDAKVGRRIEVIRYEELVRDPHGCMRSLLTCLGISATDEDLAVIDRTLRRVEGNSSYDGGLTGVYTRAVGRWTDTNKLKTHERALVEWLIGPTLVLAGYGLGRPQDVPLKTRAKAAVAKLFWLGGRLVRFRANVGYWPPPHLAEVMHWAVRPMFGRAAGFGT